MAVSRPCLIKPGADATLAFARVRLCVCVCGCAGVSFLIGRRNSAHSFPLLSYIFGLLTPSADCGTGVEQWCISDTGVGCFPSVTWLV